MRAAASALHLTRDTDLVEALSELETKMRQDYARMLGLVSEIDTRGIATTLGYSNTAALFVHTLRISRAEARHRIAQAEVLHDTITPTGSVIEAALPQTAAALARGDIGSDHVDAIHKTLKDLPHLDPEKRASAEKVMLDRAAQDDPNALTRFGWRIRDFVDPDGPPPVDNEPQRAERELHRHKRRDGSMDFKGRLDAANAALLDALLVPFEKREADDDRGHAERAGDALVDILKLAANCPDLPTHNGMKAEMTLTVSLDFLHQALDDALLPGQSYLTARDARLAACDAHVLPAVMDGDSKPVDIAVPAYVVPAHIRRALVLRDRGCTFPTCSRPASTCDSHHIVPWLQGGPTGLENLVLVCQKCTTDCYIAASGKSNSPTMLRGSRLHPMWTRSENLDATTYTASHRTPRTRVPFLGNGARASAR